MQRRKPSKFAAFALNLFTGSVRTYLNIWDLKKPQMQYPRELIHIMHLVIISPFPPAMTGIGQYGYHITRALVNSRSFSRVTVLAGSQINGEYPNHLGETEIEYCWTPDKLNTRQSILSRVKVLNPDLIWFNLGVSIFGKSPLANLSGVFTPMLLQRMGYPTVVTLHELMELSDLQALNAPGGPFARWAARWLTNIATQADIVCVTRNHYADWLAKRMVDCAYIPHGTFDEPVMLGEINEAEILLFTTLAPFKGVELLLQIFPDLKKEFPHLQLTIAGEEHPRFPGYVQSVKNRFISLPGVKWLGKIPSEDVIELFRQTQIVVLPYKASTGSSSVLYRAASWGRAVVASDLDEMRTLANDDNFQIEFFENGNIESLKNAIRALLTSPEKRRKQAQNNFKAIQSSRIEITCHRYLQAFNCALEKRHSPKRITIPLVEQEPA